MVCGSLPLPFSSLCLFPSLLGLFSFDVDFFLFLPFLLSILELIGILVIYVVSVEQWISFGDDDDEECGL